VAIERDGRWVARRKRSDDPGKSTLAGRLEAWRVVEDGRAQRDVIAPLGSTPPPSARSLLVPLLRSGARVRPSGTVFDARDRAARELAELPPEVLQLERPMGYPVSIAGVSPAEGASPCAS
jgi:hypothetical protein